MAFTEKYVTVTGGGLHDGSSEANAWTLAEGIANYAAGDRVNVKSGTYSASSSITWSTAGGQYTPIHWRGYKTTIGDMDYAPTTQRSDGTDIPFFDNSDRFLITVGNIHFSNISFESDFSNAAVQNNGGKSVVFSRCRFVSKSSSTTARAFLTTGDYNTLDSCYFEAPATAQATLYIYSGSVRSNIINSFITGSVIGLRLDSFTGATVVNTVITNSASNAVNFSGNVPCSFIGCTFHDSVSDLVSAGSQDGNSPTIITGCTFSESGGYAINQTTGQETPFVMLSNNLYHDASFTSGRLNNIVYDQNASVDSSSPFVDAAAGDFTLASSSNGHGKAFLFENAGPTSYRDLGAIQHADPSGGGGSTFHPLAQ